ncbi:right-handed parallel beta-helix repeat-containing protein [Intrasporangium sp. YIM S08009]|uniref:right-handed parallel beta-helix repeat-containing protein n=1 Tax=Intrasporangium zincisolvens TaxID=3080018 RepID=UPI002B0560E7|nr:right-handed parallel beta-helix repeat-containing protein [Intrasporangium sp. YIM S08009]
MVDAHVGPTLSAPSSGDSTSILRAFLATSTPRGVKRLIGSFSVSSGLMVPAGVYLDASQATITQTASNAVTLTLGSGSTLFGGQFIGKGTDYVAGSSPLAMGVSVAADNVTISQTRFTNFSGAAIRLSGTAGVRIVGVTIVGVGPGISSGVGSPGFGILLSGGNSYVGINDVDISGTSQGIIGSLTDTHVMIDGSHIHDIRGQHGVYLQNGTGVNIAGLDLRSIPLNGLKIQLSAASAGDSVATSITGVTADSCGDVAVSLNNTASDLRSAKKFRAVTVSNVTATNCGRGLYLGSVRGGTISNVAVYNCMLDGLTILDSHDVEGTALVVDTCGRVGLRFSSTTGSSQDRIRLSGVRIHNAGNKNVARNIYGVYVAQGSNITLDGLVVTATNRFMQYGLFLASTVARDQRTFALRNADLSGDTGSSARFQNPRTTVKDWGNNRMTGAPTFKPTGVSAVVAVP